MKEKKKKRKKIKIVIGVLISLLLLVVLSGVALYSYLDDSKYVKLKGDKADLNVSQEAEEKSKTRNIQNILLLGVDKEEDASDSIMILTIDKENKKVKLTSLLRDMYVYHGDDKINKLNYAYHYGGVEGSVSEINKLFNLDIQKYVKVSFDELIYVVDAIGGIDINITKSEVAYIPGITKAGVNHLNGEQTLAYSRIRKIDSDIKRSARQRDVLMAILNKAKTIPVKQMPQLVKDVSSTVETNASIIELADVGRYILQANIEDLEELRIPLDNTTEHMTVNNVYYTKWDEQINGDALHKFIYGE